MEVAGPPGPKSDMPDFLGRSLNNVNFKIVQ